MRIKNFKTTYLYIIWPQSYKVRCNRYNSVSWWFLFFMRYNFKCHSVTHYNYMLFLKYIHLALSVCFVFSNS